MRNIMGFFASLPRHYVREDLPEGAYLISAAQFWNRQTGKFIIPKVIPERKYFIDSGAYSFPFGVPYRWDEYAEFCRAWNPVFVSTIDAFCSAAGTVAWLQKHVDEVLLSGLPFIPVITGRTPAEYAWCLEQTRQLFGVFMPRRIAVGGLKRNGQVVPMMKRVMESGMKYHLFGATIAQLKMVVRSCGPQVDSSDSGSWNGRFGTRIEMCNRLMREKGMTQRQVALHEFLPAYRESVFNAFYCAEM
jgi:hypothetical protein